MGGEARAGARLSALTLRHATAADAAALAAFKLASFRETFVDGFAIPYPPDDLATFEAASYGLATILAELRDPMRTTWVAEAEGAFCGYAQIGPCKLPHPDVRADHGELHQLYLDRSAQGTGLAQALMVEAMAQIGRRFPGPVWLGVWSGNARAQAFYRRHGFVPVGHYRFPVGSWHDEEQIFRRG